MFSSTMLAIHLRHRLVRRFLGSTAVFIHGVQLNLDAHLPKSFDYFPRAERRVLVEPSSDNLHAIVFRLRALFIDSTKLLEFAAFAWWVKEEKATFFIDVRAALQLEWLARFKISSF